MKKYVGYFAGALMLTALASCGGDSKPGYTFKGSVPETATDLEGQMVYLYDLSSKDVLDSAKVTKSAFEFKNSVEAPKLAGFSTDPQNMVVFILENAPLTLNAATNSVEGSESNKALSAYQKQMQELNDKLGAIRNDIFQNTEDKAEAGKLWEEQLDIIVPQMGEVVKTTFNANSDNLVGLVALQAGRGLLEPAEYAELINKAGASLQEDKFVKEAKAKIEAQNSTAVGQKFVDFSVAKEDGTIQNFSDYIGKGKYVLVDFWASWCGPCMREVPNLKEVYKKYKSNKFEILGVAVWDKEADSVGKIESMGMTWPSILNAQKVPTDLYGISGIPQIMLFGPDGTILERDLRGDGIVEAIKKHVK